MSLKKFLIPWWEKWFPKLPAHEIAGQTWLRNAEGKVKLFKGVIPTVRYDPLNELIIGDAPQTESNDISGTGNCDIDIPLGEVWLILVCQASFLCDATVADRTGTLQFPDLGLGGIAGTDPNTLLSDINATPLTASQYGYLVLQGNGQTNGYEIDNGASTSLSSSNQCPIYIAGGGKIRAKYIANGQAGDKVGLDILYKRVV